MATEIFKNQTTNATVEAEVADNGIIQVDMSGVIDGADVLTEYLNDAGVYTKVRDCCWMTSEGDVPWNGAGSTKYIHKRPMRFSIVNAGALTDICMFASHEAGIKTI